MGKNWVNGSRWGIYLGKWKEMGEYLNKWG